MTTETITAKTHIHLPINIGTELLIEIVDLNLRIKGWLVGMEGSAYLIVKLSPKDLVGNFRSDAVKDSPIIVRYLFKGSVYGFKTSVLNIVSIPAKLIFVNYPESIEGFNVRTNPRYECILPAETKFGGAKPFETVIVDISREGCRCVIKTFPSNRDALYSALEVNKTASIGIVLPGTDDKLMLNVAIRNVNKDEERVIFGARFDEMNETVKTRLDDFISLISTIENKGK